MSWGDQVWPVLLAEPTWQPIPFNSAAANSARPDSCRAAALAA